MVAIIFKGTDSFVPIGVVCIIFPIEVAVPIFVLNLFIEVEVVASCLFRDSEAERDTLCCFDGVKIFLPIYFMKDIIGRIGDIVKFNVLEDFLRGAI